jgi:hypothetical protein
LPDKSLRQTPSSCKPVRSTAKNCGELRYSAAPTVANPVVTGRGIYPDSPGIRRPGERLAGSSPHPLYSCPFMANADPGAGSSAASHDSLSSSGSRRAFGEGRPVNPHRRLSRVPGTGSGSQISCRPVRVPPFAHAVPSRLPD